MVTAVDLTLQPFYASIRGVVVDAETGARLTGVRVNIGSPYGGWYTDAITGEGGKFETEPVLLDETYLVVTRPPFGSQHLSASIETTVRFADDPRPEVEVRQTRGGTLRGGSSTNTETASSPPSSGSGGTRDPPTGRATTPSPALRPERTQWSRNTTSTTTRASRPFR